jgi:photosystem II stability/assembly factor-like uncharacterized protein
MRSQSGVACCRKYLLALLLLAFSGVALAQHGGDPPGGEITALVIDPVSTSIAYVGTASGGVFKSTNGGLTWTTSESGLTNVTYIIALAIAPSATSTLYAATDQGIFISTNAGVSWTAKPLGVTGIVYSLAVDPTSAATVYAGASVSSNAAVFRSTNSGDNWSPVSTGFAVLPSPPASLVSALAIDPSTPTTLYAGTLDGVYKTVNSGGLWSPANAGFPATPFVSSIALVPGTASSLYVSTFDQGVFKSTNSAGSWTAASTGLWQEVYAVAINPAATNTLYAATFRGLFKTQDAANWTRVTALPFDSILSVGIAPGTGAVLAGATQGVFRSTNSGTTFSRANSGITSNAMASLLFPAGASTPLYAGTKHSGIFRTADGGTTWSDLSFLDADTSFSALAYVPSTGVLYIGTAPGGIYASANDFQTTVQGAAPLASIKAFAVDPSVTSTVYAASDVGVWKTTDYTASPTPWALANTGLTNTNVLSLVINPQGVLYAGTLGGGVFTSVNSGASWSPVNTGLPSVSLIPALAIDPVSANTIYAVVTSATTTDVYRTTDGGSNWSVVGTTLISGLVLEDLIIDPSNPAILYACDASGVYKSSTSGSAWTLANTGLPSSLITSGGLLGCRVRVDPGSSSNVFVSTGRGVYKSTDGALSWSPTGVLPPASRKVRAQITSN